MREKGRQNLEEESQKTEEFRSMPEDLYGQVLAVQQQIEMAGSEGTSVTKAKGRIERAESLDKEAQAAFDKKRVRDDKAKSHCHPEYRGDGATGTARSPVRIINPPGGTQKNPFLFQ